MALSNIRARSRQSLSGLSKVMGYGSSMVLLAIASLVIIPEMIQADGRHAWGSIALGQAVGAIAAVVIAYGWQLHGPAIVARGDATVKRRALEESAMLKATLFLPVAAVAVLLASLLAPSRADLAAAGAVSTASVGLTAGWFFIGISRPYQFLGFETVPRVLGTVVGIVAMRQGEGALTGVLCQLGGMLFAACCSYTWLLTRNRAPEARLPPRSVLYTLRHQINGVSASTLSAVFLAAPLIIVSGIAPAIQPAYALVDKIQRQISVGLGPFVSVVQGWVPRARDHDLARRARVALALSAGGSVALAAMVWLCGPVLVGYLGDGDITVSQWVYLLMGVVVGLLLLESCLSRAILPALDRLDVVARATVVSAVVGLPLVAAGALLSVEGALAGLALGLLGRALAEALACVKWQPADRNESHLDPGSTPA